MFEDDRGGEEHSENSKERMRSENMMKDVGGWRRTCSKVKRDDVRC